MMNLDIERGTIELRSDFITGEDANVLIGVVGSVAGMVLYSFPKQTALEMVKSLSGMEMNDLDVFVTCIIKGYNYVCIHFSHWCDKEESWCSW